MKLRMSEKTMTRFFHLAAKCSRGRRIATQNSYVNAAPKMSAGGTTVTMTSWSRKSALHASDVFWDLLNSTTGYDRPAVYAFRDEWEAHSHRAAAAQRALKDPVAREEKESADAAAEVLLELERFDRRVTKPGRSQPTGKGLAVKPLAEPHADAASKVGGTLAWSDEAARVAGGELPPGLCGAEVQGAFRSLRIPAPVWARSTSAPSPR